MELNRELIERILNRGSDVVIRRRKKNGELVDVIFESKMHIAEEKPTSAESKEKEK